MAYREEGEGDPIALLRRPFATPGEGRRPTRNWPREIPIEGHPADVVEIVEAYSAWLARSGSVRKLFVNADPGAILTGAERERSPLAQGLTARKEAVAANATLDMTAPTKLSPAKAARPPVGPMASIRKPSDTKTTATAE